MNEGTGQEWQPIETAPTDVVIQAYSKEWLWMGSNGVQRGFVHSDYNGHKNVFTMDGRGGHVPKAKPTHWMPLPNPPARGE